MKVFNYIKLMQTLECFDSTETKAMSEDRDDTPAKGVKSRFPWSDLKGLIEILQYFQRQITVRLLEKRTQATKSSGTRQDGLEIARSLKEFIDTNVNPQPLEKVSPPVPAAEAQAADSEHNIKSPVDLPLQPSELSEHLNGHAANRHFESQLASKMRLTTLEHLNQAKQLAKEGNRDGAYIHAELAANSMQLACEHMTEEEYLTFQDELKNRIKTAKLSASQGDTSDSE